MCFLYVYKYGRSVPFIWSRLKNSHRNILFIDWIAMHAEFVSSSNMMDFLWSNETSLVIYFFAFHFHFYCKSFLFILFCVQQMCIMVRIQLIEFNFNFITIQIFTISSQTKQFYFEKKKSQFNRFICLLIWIKSKYNYYLAVQKFILFNCKERKKEKTRGNSIGYWFKMRNRMKTAKIAVGQLLKW